MKRNQLIDMGGCVLGRILKVFPNEVITISQYGTIRSHPHEAFSNVGFRIIYNSRAPSLRKMKQRAANYEAVWKRQIRKLRSSGIDNDLVYSCLREIYRNGIAIRNNDPKVFHHFRCENHGIEVIRYYELCKPMLMIGMGWKLLVSEEIIGCVQDSEIIHGYRSDIIRDLTMSYLQTGHVEELYRE